LTWLPGHEKEVDEEGADHDFAAELSIKGSQMAAQMAEKMYRKDPQAFEQAKIKPVFHMAKIYQRMGIPMVVMTANDEPFAKAICKCLGLADSFVTLACQKDFVGRGKEGAMEYLIEKLKEKGIPIPKNLIVVGDSLNGDIGSGAKFMSEHGDYSVKGVLVGEGDVEAAKERIKNDSQLENMPVEFLNPELVSNNAKGIPSLARYRRKYDTK
jgi:phosphoglycolate phosphatase-like HAD superfamily hydrolase